LGHNRLELDLGLSDFKGGVNFAGTYQWVKPLVGSFGWYFGVGAGVGLWNKSTAVSGLGQLGLEYNFRLPFQVSLDWRPGVSLKFNDGLNVQFWATSLSLSVRYRL
jgi:hypothetical protein